MVNNLRLTKGLMITENEVIEKVVNYLEERGYDIISQCNTKEKGIDIKAYNNNTKKYVLVEAKGGTSATNSKKQGKPFNRGQANTHISVGLFKLFSLMNDHKNSSDYEFILAVPFEKDHVEWIESIREVVKSLNIQVLFCSKEVILELDMVIG